MTVTQEPPKVRDVTFRHAIRDALRAEMSADPSVVLLGEDIGPAGGVFKVTDGLYEQFGPQRVWDTPISETAIVGAALGAAMGGLRPVAELMFADFAAVAMDQLVNQVAKCRYMSAGRLSVPLVVRAVSGAGFGFGSQHSSCPESWFMHTPGWRVVAPSNPADAYTMLRWAVRSPDPVLFFEHKMLYGRSGALDDIPPDGAEPTTGALLRAGDAATVVATQLMVHRAAAAADQLADDGIHVDLVDLRTLAPLDVELLLTSVGKTRRLVTVEENPRECGWGAEVASLLAERLTDPPQVRRVTAPSTPVPFSPPLEKAWMPSEEQVVAAVRSVVSA